MYFGSLNVYSLSGFPNKLVLFDNTFSIIKNQHDNKFFEVGKWKKANVGMLSSDSDSATQNP